MVKKYVIKYNKHYIKELKKIPQKDRGRILEKILALSTDPRPPHSKKLRGPHHPSLYRIRIGDYRAVYTIKDNVLVILIIAIGKRKDIYRNFE